MWKDLKFKTRLGYIARPYPKQTNEKHTKYANLSKTFECIMNNTKTSLYR
jgi:hypothetical protein